MEPSTRKGKGVGALTGGEVDWNVGAREGIGIFLSLLVTPVDPLCTLTLEGRARVLDLGRAWERNFGLKNPGCIYPANLAGMTP